MRALSNKTTRLESRLIPEGDEVALPGGYRGILVTRSEDRAGLQGVYLVRHGSQACIYKVYGNRRNPIRQWGDCITSFLEGRSNPDATARLKVEQDTLRIWRRHGFPVFREVPSAPIIEFGAPVLCLEYVPGATAADYFGDPGVGQEAKFDALRTLVAEWGKRHQLAKRLSEPLLVHEHPSLGHLWRGEDGCFFTFDFEVAFTRAHHIDQLIAREILRLTRAVLAIVPAKDRSAYLDLILKNYPLPEYFKIAYIILCKSPNPFVRAFRFIERRTARNRKPLSRFQMADLIVKQLQYLQRI